MLFVKWTRMTTKDQMIRRILTYIKYLQILQNIILFISKLIFVRIMNIRQLFQVKNVLKSQKSTFFKWTCGLFRHNYRVATLSTLYISVKPKLVMLQMDILTFCSEYRVASLLKRNLTAKGIIPESLKSRVQF